MRNVKKKWLTGGLVGALLFSVVVGCNAAKGEGEVEIVNVSYDPTRELYQDVNKAFASYYQKEKNQLVRVTQSHGGSGAQARSVIDGLKADVVTLALAGDIDAISKKGLLPENWQSRLPNNSSPYTSTVVFLVRKGNPKNIKDWPDLIQEGVKVVTPNPKTSGGARWNFLAAWGYVVIKQGKSEADAIDFIRKLYGHVAKLDTGSRGSTETFLQRKQGDVLIAWENEAILARREAAKDGLEIIYPLASVLAEPPVAVVDQNVQEHGTREVAEAYLKFLYTDEAQEIIAKNGYRPINAKFGANFPAIKLFTLKELAGDWSVAQKKFFADGGVFDQAYQAKSGR